jgi:hypothetical protein
VAYGANHTKGSNAQRFHCVIVSYPVRTSPMHGVPSWHSEECHDVLLLDGMLDGALPGIRHDLIQVVEELDKCHIPWMVRACCAHDGGSMEERIGATRISD